MQYKNEEYNPEIHDRFRALTVKQPYADMLVKAAYRDGNGVVYPVKQIEVRSKPTKYRGDLLVCSSATPVYPGKISGATLGFVELYDVKPVYEFTLEDWAGTCINNVEERDKYKNGYGWFVRNPRKVVEMPIKGQLGIYNLVYTKDDIIEYPTECHVDKQSWRIIQNKIKNGTGK